MLDVPVPVEEEERHVLHRVADVRQVQPFLRGACEGLVYYMLEARQETRGRFSANARVALAVQLQNMVMMREAIEKRAGETLAAENSGPLLKGKSRVRDAG